MHSTFELNILQGMASAIEKQNKEKINFSVSPSLNNIAKSLEQQIKPINTFSFGGNTNGFSNLSAIPLPKTKFQLIGLNSSLLEFAKKNQKVSESLNGFAISQFLLSNKLNGIAEVNPLSHLNMFNSIDIASLKDSFENI